MNCNKVLWTPLTGCFREAHMVKGHCASMVSSLITSKWTRYKLHQKNYNKNTCTVWSIIQNTQFQKNCKQMLKVSENNTESRNKLWNPDILPGGGWSVRDLVKLWSRTLSLSCNSQCAVQPQGHLTLQLIVPPAVQLRSGVTVHHTFPH